jgi:hypothetical protein
MAITAITAAGSGRDTTVLGTGSMSIPRLTSAGTALAFHGGTGALSIAALTMVGNGYGSGLASPIGTGAMSLPAFAASGIGIQTSYSLTAFQATRILRQEFQELRKSTEKAEKTFTLEIDSLRERLRDLEGRVRRGLR